MENQFTVISYNNDDLQLIKKAEPLQIQEQEHLQVQEQEHLQVQEQDHLQVQEQEHLQIRDKLQVQEQEYLQVQEQDHLQVQEQEHLQIQDKLQVQEQEYLQVQEQEHLQVQEQEHLQVQEQEHLQVQEQEKKKPQKTNISFHFSIKDRLDLDILNKTVIKNSVNDIIINFDNDNTILINNSELSIPFQFEYTKVGKDEGCSTGLEAVDSINYIKEITYNKIVYTIKINSNKYRDYIITDDKYMKNVDKYYDFIDKYRNRDTKILTEDEILKIEKYEKLNIKINMNNNKDIEKFIDELCDEIDFKNLQFDIVNWKKKDYIILRTLNDLLIALFNNIINGFNNLCKCEQLKIIKQLLNMYLKYHDNIMFLNKCSIGNNDLYITITAKLFEFYTINNIFESILCFIKYAPEYCNEHYYPVPQTGKMTITGDHDMEILNNKYLKDIYLQSKNYLLI